MYITEMILNIRFNVGERHDVIIKKKEKNEKKNTALQ